MRLQLTVAYDGSCFLGWQSQPGGGTVQDHLESAFAALTGGKITVHGAGRTDTGVHALAQTAHADVPADRFPAEKWPAALNAHLPPGVRVLRSRRVPDSFHARFSARGKIYRYAIWNGPVMPPLENGRSWHVPWTLDRDRLAKVAKVFEGRHDFHAFCAARPGATKDTIRRIDAITLRRRGEKLELTFVGEGFLYKMVRVLTAALVRCAAGRVSAEELSARLAAAGPRFNHVAPAGGLCLVRVRY